MTIARTDPAGRFDEPRWTALPKPYPVIDVRMQVSIYKPGFDLEQSFRQAESRTDWTLVKTRRTASERLWLLSHLAEFGCRGEPPDDPQSVQVTLRALLYAEARQLGPLEEKDRFLLEMLKRIAEPPPSGPRPMRIEPAGPAPVPQAATLPATPAKRE